MELSKEQKIAIIQRELSQHAQAIYTLTMQGRCASAIKNAKMVDNCQKLLEENTLAAAFYQEELEKLNKE